MSLLALHGASTRAPGEVRSLELESTASGRPIGLLVLSTRPEYGPEAVSMEVAAAMDAGIDIVVVDLAASLVSWSPVVEDGSGTRAIVAETGFWFEAPLAARVDEPMVALSAGSKGAPGWNDLVRAVRTSVPGGAAVHPVDPVLGSDRAVRRAARAGVPVDGDTEVFCWRRPSGSGEGLIEVRVGRDRQGVAVGEVELRVPEPEDSTDDVAPILAAVESLLSGREVERLRVKAPATAPAFLEQLADRGYGPVAAYATVHFVRAALLSVEVP